MYETVEHAFAPVADERSRVLVLGTMPSPASRENGFYYSHPRNRFWPVLAALYGEEPPKTPQEKTSFALAHGIALWDVLRSCEIEGAADSSIRRPVANDVPALLERYGGITAVFTTGTTAARLYRASFPGLTIPHTALPSTSPANCRASFGELLAAYAAVKAAAENSELDRH